MLVMGGNGPKYAIVYQSSNYIDFAFLREGIIGKTDGISVIF